MANDNKVIYNEHQWARAATINSQGRQDVVQHSHPNNVNVHLHLDNITATANYIIVDISDTTNYPHGTGSTSYAHIENLWLDIDADNNADYEIAVGYLKDVVASAGTFTHLYSITGTKTAGNSKSVFLPFYPNGARMDNGYVVTNDYDIDAIYGSGTTLPSVLDPTTSNVIPGNSDVIINIVRNAGSFNLSLNMSYHAH